MYSLLEFTFKSYFSFGRKHLWDQRRKRRRQIQAGATENFRKQLKRPAAKVERDMRLVLLAEE